MPRKRKELAPPEKLGPLGPSGTNGTNGTLVVHPKVLAIYEQYGDPLEEMAKMAKSLDGNIFSEDSLATRARLLSELARYGYSQFKGRDAESNAQAQKVEINIVGIEPKLVTSKE